MGTFARIVVLMLMMKRGLSALAEKNASAYLCGCGHPKDWHFVDFNAGLPAKSCKGCGCVKTLGGRS